MKRPPTAADGGGMVGFVSKEVRMSDIISVVKVWLDEVGLTYEMEGDGVRFLLPFGSANYDCLVWAQGKTTMVISAAWHGAVPPDRIDEAKQLLRKFIEVGDGCGHTLLNRRTGQLMRQMSMDVSMVQLKPQAMDRIIEKALDPFNVMILALMLVLQGRMKAEQAIETYAAREKGGSEVRMAKLRRARTEDEIDPTLN
jgi:hypothetical protein